MIEVFREAFRDRYKIAQEEKAKGRPGAGFLCTYVPEEIFHAAGLFPVRVLGSPGDTSTADAYLFSNNCSFVKSCLEQAFEGKYDFLFSIVSCNSCDHIRRLLDVWSKYLSTPFTYLLPLPHKMSEASVDYFHGELVRMSQGLEQALGRKISEQALRDSIKVYNRMRLLLKKLYELRKAPQPPISGSEVMEVVLAGMVMPKERYGDLLEGLIEDLAKRPSLQANDKIRLMVVGSELDDPEYISLIEDMGGLVVIDDLCIGTRYFWDLVDEDEEPLKALARRYLTRCPCARMRPAHPRIEHIRQLIEDYNVEAIVYEMIKFCDIYGMDLPIFKEGLSQLSLPILPLDREYQRAGVSQLKTRVQAFFESLAP